MARSDARVRVVVDGRAALATARLAITSIDRMIGLLRDRHLETGDGLVLQPATSIHTCFMRFEIDVLFADATGAILHLAHRVKPFRLVSGGRSSRTVVELPAGTLQRAQVHVGSRIDLEVL